MIIETEEANMITADRWINLAPTATFKARPVTDTPQEREPRNLEQALTRLQNPSRIEAR